MPPRGLEPAGLVLVDKPAGPSSFALVRQLRSATGARAGHAGTLDPFATGLLLVLLGAATRLAQYLVGLDKRYETLVDLRSTTASGDLQGEPLEEHDPLASDDLEERLAALRGTVELRVPAVSAVKIAGERAYKLARAGVEVEMPVRTSQVHELELVDYDRGLARLRLHVSSGTYVRAIADALGGHCLELRRTTVGPFSVEDADPERIVPPLDVLPFLPLRELDDADTAAVRNGRAIAGAGEGRTRLAHAGRLVAVAAGDGETIRPETVMP
jgi:tRNA pseudouridine55 synthase